MFIGKEQNDPVLVRKVIQILAKIHSLDVPIKKKAKVLFELMVRSYEEAVKKFPINDFIEEYNCETLKKYDLKAEIDWIKGAIERANSPVVFTHNDFRSHNLLITEPNDELVVCDFDFSRYEHRGSDFVCLIREWGRKPMEYKSIEGLPLESQFKPLIEIYVEECERIYGKSYSQNPINSVDHILKEVKTFLLFSYLFSTVNFMKEDEGSVEFMLTRKLIMVN
jgi:aminoglycoside phosphotransferase (APT) family kinase protein